MKSQHFFSCCIPAIERCSSLEDFKIDNLISSCEIIHVDMMSVNTESNEKLSPESECSLFRNKDRYTDVEVLDVAHQHSASTVCSGSVHSDLSMSHPFAPGSNEALCGSVMRLHRERDKVMPDLCVTGKAITPELSHHRVRSVTSAPEEDCGYSFTPFGPAEYGKPRFGKTDLTNTDSGEDLGSLSAHSDSSSNLSTASTENVSTNSSSHKSLGSAGLSIKSAEGGASLSPHNTKCPAAAIQGHSLMAGDLIITDLDGIDDAAEAEKPASPQSKHSQELVTIVRGSMKPTFSFPFRREKPLVAWGDKDRVGDEKPVQTSESSLVRKFRGAFGRRRVERPKGAKQRDTSQVSTLPMHGRK